MLAKALNQTDWVRERKENWQAATPWDRRAIIWAGTALSPDERNYWLKRVQGSQDILDAAIAEATLRVGNSAKPTPLRQLPPPSQVARPAPIPGPPLLQIPMPPQVVLPPPLPAHLLPPDVVERDVDGLLPHR